MMVPLMRAALVLAACTGLMACSQRTTRYGSADIQPSPGRTARLCIAEGHPGSAGTAPDRSTWSITVSSEGGPCTHSRGWGGVEQSYLVTRPPAHGQISQEIRDGVTLVSYTPERGFIGSDSFALRYPPRNMVLSYLVGVVP